MRVMSENDNKSSMILTPAVRQTRLLQCHMGVSENSVPLNPMVNDHYPY